MNFGRPKVDRLVMTPPVARRLGDRAVFVWGVVWTTVVVVILGVCWAQSLPGMDPLWALAVFVSVLGASALTVAVSRVDATLVMTVGPAMLLIALQSTTPAAALAVWGTACFVGTTIRLRHLGDGAETAAYLLGCGMIATATLSWLDAAGVGWVVSSFVGMAAYVLARLAISSIRLFVVTRLSPRDALHNLLLLRAVMSWLAISVATIAGLAIQHLAIAYHPLVGEYWGGTVAIVLFGFSAFAIGMARESRVVATQLNGVLDAALGLPWVATSSINDHARDFAQRTLPRYTVELRQQEGRNVNELVAPIADGFLVARRGPIQPPFLVQEQRVLDAIAHIADTMAAAHRERESLSLAAATDVLTGLPNYRGFREELAAIAQDATSGIAVVYVDVDGFKEVNDRHGHETGNAVLRTLATRLRTRLPATDLVARVGGDEFVLILTDVADETSGCHRTAALLREASAPVFVEGSVIALRLSSGLAFAEPGEADITQLVEAADARMYAARGRRVKGSGGLPVIKSGTDVSELVATVTDAIKHRRLAFAYQPIVDCIEDRIIGIEALVRARDPELRHLPADLIVHEARRLGLLTDLSVHLVETATQDMRRFQEIAPGLTHLCLNIDVEQVIDPAFESALAEAGRAGDVRFTLELSETSLRRSSDDIHRELDRLRAEHGVRIALDDFGRDSSTLLSILEYPLDVLKIDKALIRGMQARKPQLVMSSLALLARNLDVRMIVEGVEREATYNELVRAGVRYMQGFRFARPLTAEHLLERLSRHGLRAYLASAPAPGPAPALTR